eukprot:NODE_7383_length_443_cov_54.113924_g7217_i0.p1 GENE.NODE_7383_length_443_cov_54.113924_g7217_i0~~NODE_7383_length_443_cov_54.113924_g7217_i0.p1  ORF type:complete len:115 (+),score=36.14 NODE_7383_length_443_cov_54.113924_g7217_i0:54-347(+)
MFRSIVLRASKVVPLGDRVLVQKQVLAKETKSGLLLPESSIKSLNQGAVVASGPDCKFSLVENDSVLLPEFGGVQVSVEGNSDLWLYRENELLAKLS